MVLARCNSLCSSTTTFLALWVNAEQQRKHHCALQVRVRDTQETLAQLEAEMQRMRLARVRPGWLAAEVPALHRCMFSTLHVSLPTWHCAGES